MRTITSIVLFLTLWACVDRVFFDVGKTGNFGVAVDGYITDQPGPYQIKITSAFDIDSKATLKVPISVKHLIVSDNKGTSEELTETTKGVYETSATGIRGQVGGVYKMRVELVDGKIFESLPDTLLPGGSMDSLYYSYSSGLTPDQGTNNGFDIFYNSSRGEGGSRFMWRMIGTYQAETRPDCDNLNCYRDGDRCNYAPLCSGLKNIGNDFVKNLVRVSDCSCCTCWYQLFNTKPLLSDDNFSTAKKFTGIQIYRVPVNPWIFMHKIHIEVRQISLTSNSFRFWKAIRDQQNAVGNIFQPVTGKIPSNFIQISGTAAPISGLFYATSLRSKSLYILRDDVPHSETLPTLEELAALSGNQIGCVSCLLAFPNSTNVKPSFWTD